MIIDNGYISPDTTAGDQGPPGVPAFLRVRAYPNPFNASVNISVETGENAPVQVAIYDTRGGLVEVLWNGKLPGGSTLLRWNGTNAQGGRVATGVYFVRAKVAGNASTIKIVLLK